MPPKIDKNTEDKIIELYKEGYSSKKIEKYIKPSKQPILRVLNEQNLIPKKEEPEEYKHFEFDKEKQLWYSFYTCEDCNKIIKCEANKKYFLRRNLKKKSVCRECSLKRMEGEGNPFYGKEHDSETKEKIIKTQAISLKTKSKPETELFNLIKRLYKNVQSQFVVNGKAFDIYIEDINLLIEFNGDYWHCNPDIYSSNYFNKKVKKYAKEIWGIDNNKKEVAQITGYNFLVIWEKDFKTKKNKIVENIKSYER